MSKLLICTFAETGSEDKLTALEAAILPAWEQAERGECFPFDLHAFSKELDLETASC